MDATTGSSATPAQIAGLIRKRKTLKVLGDVERPVEISDAVATANQDKIMEAIRTAGWAPFHYDRSVGGLAEPWRVHVLWHPECRQVAREFDGWFDQIKSGNKLPAMLSACGAVVLVTWLPQFRSGHPTHLDSTSNAESVQEVVPPDKQLAVDEEHLAATAAMIQNLLLMLTAFGMGTYWSSGGQFQSSIMLDKLGIDLSERLLAAVFVEFPETMGQEIERVPGKQRDRRSLDYRWLDVVTLAKAKE
jgi:nitroreductase